MLAQIQTSFTLMLNLVIQMIEEQLSKRSKYLLHWSADFFPRLCQYGFNFVFRSVSTDLLFDRRNAKWLGVEVEWSFDKSFSSGNEIWEKYCWQMRRCLTTDMADANEKKNSSQNTISRSLFADKAFEARTEKDLRYIYNLSQLILVSFFETRNIRIAAQEFERKTRGK